MLLELRAGLIPDAFNLAVGVHVAVQMFRSMVKRLNQTDIARKRGEDWEAPRSNRGVAKNQTRRKTFRFSFFEFSKYIHSSLQSKGSSSPSNLPTLIERATGTLFIRDSPRHSVRRGKERQKRSESDHLSATAKGRAFTPYIDGSVGLLYGEHYRAGRIARQDMKSALDPPFDLPVTPVLDINHGRHTKADFTGSRRFPVSLQDSPDTVMYERTVNSIYDSYAVRRETATEGAIYNNGM